jgi:hypothetical protein
MRSPGEYWRLNPEACRAFCSTIEAMVSRIVVGAAELGNTA